MKLAGTILFVLGLFYLSACDSGDVEQVFNREKRVLQNKLNKERMLRIGLQAYIDSILNKDTFMVMNKMEHYAETLFADELSMKNGKNSTPPSVKKAPASEAIQSLENQLAGWVQKLPPQNWKLKEMGSDRLSLLIGDQALFVEKSAELNSSGIKKLEELSQQLKKYTRAEIALQIESHVDSLSRREADHWQFGWERAQNVGNTLIGAGFPASHLSLGSHGATAPVATNATEAGRYLNRRTLLIFSIK
jgi:outer membrane protein OmpA-like peptidoglycan-associated protein